MTEKIAFVTGASRGLGKSMLEHLVEGGVGVVGTYRSAETEARSIETTFANGPAKVRMLQLDVSDAATFPAFKATLTHALRETFGCEHLDYVVQNAGTGVLGATTEMTGDELDVLYRTDFKGPLLLSQTLLPLIRDGGRIVNISSAATRFYIEDHGPYAAFKAGIEVITLYMAKELGKRGIRVNVVAPGAIETDFLGGEVRDDEGLNHMFKEATSLGRVGRPGDVGSVIRALLSADMGWVNGQRIEVTGGQSL